MLLGEAVEAIHAQYKLSDYASRYTRLKRQGRQVMGLCPLPDHAERTPSFSVSDDKGVWYCLAGETMVVTWDGEKPISQIAGTTQTLLTEGGRWVEAPIYDFGQQKLWKVELSRNGRKKTIFATAGHRWFATVSTNASRTRYPEVTTENLKPGMYLRPAKPANRFPGSTPSVQRKVFEAAQPRYSRLRWRVVSIEPTDRVETVYCAEVESTHSFVIEGGILTGNCHGCKRGGDIIELAKHLEGYSFPEAVRSLGEDLGLQIDEGYGDAVRARQMLAEAEEFYLQQLAAYPRAAEYLRGRGLDEATIMYFRLGYAGEGLSRHLKQYGDARVQYGLSHHKDGKVFDHLRDRVIFPVHDPRGRPLAFQGRTLSDQTPKYLHTAETPLWKKRDALYGFDKSRDMLLALGYGVITEGPLDTLKVWQSGIAAVGILGSGVSRQQVHQLRAAGAEKVLLGLDRDKAGNTATIKAIQGLRGVAGLRIVRWPQGKKDPGQLSEDEIRASVEAAITPGEFLVRYSRFLHPHDADLRLEWLGEFLRPVDPTDTLPDDIALRLGREGLVVEVGKAHRRQPVEQEMPVDKLRLLEADIAAILFSVREPQARKALALKASFRVMPREGGLLAPVLDALSTSDPLSHLMRLGAGDLFFRRISKAPEIPTAQAERRIIELSDRHEILMLESLLTQTRQRIESEGASDTLALELTEYSVALDTIRRNRLTL